MNIIFWFTILRFTLHRALRFQSKAVVMADQNSLDATDIGKKNVFDTTNIDEPLDISYNNSQNI